MTATLTSPALSFQLPEELIADAPIEARGGRRDEARLLVAWKDDDRMVDTTFANLGQFLEAGDVLVVNTSATLPAAVSTRDGRLLHFSTALPGDLWVVELREPCHAGSRPSPDGRPGDVIALPGGAEVHLLAPFGQPASDRVRLWVSRVKPRVAVPAFLEAFGRPIRYGCPDTSWALSAYQTVFAQEPGSAEMPSAARAFTPELVTELVGRGTVFAPITLHTGVSSLEAGELPYPEWYHVPSTAAELVNAARANGHRVIAVGTTATRAIESAADQRGVARPGSGWTDLVVTPGRGVRVVDGLITGWHEPEASHLQLLEAVGGRPVLERSYRHALEAGYRWHEFGDLHLILPGAPRG